MTRAFNSHSSIAHRAIEPVFLPPVYSRSRCEHARKSTGLLETVSVAKAAQRAEDSKVQS
jgi:hypothetical protein